MPNSFTDIRRLVQFQSRRLILAVPSSEKKPVSPEEIRSRLADLEPNIPWAHHYEFAEGIESVDPSDEKFYRKSVSLKMIGEIYEELSLIHTRRGSMDGLRVLDVGCGEGVHSVELARKGAEVTAVDGRNLYIRRAGFAAEAKGVKDRIRLVEGDVRDLESKGLGRFDLVLASGILHHLNQEAFLGFLQALSNLSNDTLILYTHISTELSVKRHRLQGPVTTDEGYEGHLFREHADDATEQQRLNQVRASLDNTHSFWATEPTLTRALDKVGFRYVFRSLKPHVFNNFENASYRPIIVARK